MQGYGDLLGLWLVDCYLSSSDFRRTSENIITEILHVVTAYRAPMIPAIASKAAGLTQLQLAEELKKNGVEIGFRSISTWENNICEPSVTVFINICKILKIKDFVAAYFDEAEAPVERAHENIKSSSHRQGHPLQNKSIKIFILYYKFPW